MTPETNIVEERPLMVRWVVGSIAEGGTTENRRITVFDLISILSFVASETNIVVQRPLSEMG